MMRNIIGQTKSAFNLRDIMDNKKILLVNLSKGRTGELNSKLLGMVFVMKFQAAAMARANIPESERKDFCLYVDEFQNFSTDSFATILSEARKYHLNLVVANQFTTQLTEEVRDAVFGNIGTIVAFRVGQDEDAEALAKRMRPAFDTSDLLRMPNYNAAVRTLIGGVPTLPFSMATLPPLGNPNEKLSNALKQLSAAKYGRPKAQVEKEIFARLATQEPEPAAPPSRGFGGAAPAAFPGSSAAPAPYGAPAAGAPRQPAAAPAGTGNFLDEWMTKREGPLAMRPSPWAKAPTQAQGAPMPSAPAPAPATGMPAPAPAAAAWPPVPSAAPVPAPPPATYSSFQPPAAPQPQPIVHPAPFAAPAAPAAAAGPSQAAAPARPTVPVQPAPVAMATSPAAATSPAGGLTHGDTIFIDQDGNIHAK
jgi:hypothetical protein